MTDESNAPQAPNENQNENPSPAAKRPPGRPAKPGGKNSNVRLGEADLKALALAAPILGVQPWTPGWESNALRALVWYSLSRMKRRNLKGPDAGRMALVPRTGTDPLAVLDAFLDSLTQPQTDSAAQG